MFTVLTVVGDIYCPTVIGGLYCPFIFAPTFCKSFNKNLDRNFKNIPSQRKHYFEPKPPILTAKKNTMNIISLLWKQTAPILIGD